MRAPRAGRMPRCRALCTTRENGDDEAPGEPSHHRRSRPPGPRRRPPHRGGARLPAPPGRGGRAPPAPGPGPAPAPAPPGPYLIGPGDMLKIVVWKEPDLTVD